jgi:hypothetical protein
MMTVESRTECDDTTAKRVTRRAFWSLLGGGVVGGAARGAAQTPSGRTFSIIDFFGQEPRAWEAVQGYPGAQYQYLAGSAASASTRHLPCDLSLRPVVRATFQAIWTAAGFQAGVELAHCDDDFVNYTRFAECRPIITQVPDIQKRDVTATINALIAAGQPKHLVVRARGDGVTGSIIFGASLELVWT